MKKALVLSLALLLAGCTPSVVQQPKVQWLSSSVKQSTCTIGGPCVVVDATLRNNGNSSLAFGSYVVYAYDHTGREIGRNSSWAFAVVRPGETEKLHIAIPGIYLEQVGYIRLVLVQTSTDSFNEANHLPWELKIPL